MIGDTLHEIDGINVFPIRHFLESRLGQSLFSSRSQFHFLLLHFKPADLFTQRIRTFRYIPGDARLLFRQCYIGVLTLLEALPEYEQSPTALFLHKKIIALFTALPALLVSHVPALGPNGHVSCSAIASSLRCYFIWHNHTSITGMGVGVWVRGR